MEKLVKNELSGIDYGYLDEHHNIDDVIKQSGQGTSLSSI